MRDYLLPTLGDVDVTCITRRAVYDVQNALAPRGLSPATVRTARSVLSQILADAVAADLLAHNPLDGARLRMPRRRDVRVTYNQAELARFLAAAGVVVPRLRLLYAVCGRAGLRVGEARALRADDVDLDAETLRVERSGLPVAGTGPTKSGLSRTVDLCRSLVAELAGHVTRHADWLFPGRRRFVSDCTVRVAMRHVCRAAGLSVASPHALRRSYASILISRGVSPEYVRRSLGHTKLTTTMEYGAHLPMSRPGLLDDL